MTETKNLPVLIFYTPREFESWLKKNHDKSPGIWIRLSKKKSPVQTITYMEAVESALCYGWIDSQKKSCDDNFWLQRFTKRKPSSIWSMINREKSLALIESGRMQKPGLNAIEAAKENGKWEAAYESQKTIAVPDDFALLLSRNRKAKVFFESLDSANRYAILFRISNSKKAGTRIKKIKLFIEMLSKEEKLH